MRKILIADDNIEMSDMMRNYLLKEGYTVYQAFDGAEALYMTKALKPDLVLLDLVLPVVDGYEVCQTLRKSFNIPIIVVSSKESENDKMKLFELGADDYITKSFSFKEMVCRVKAQLRRFYDLNNQQNEHTRVFGKLVIYSDSLEVKVDDEVLNLSAREYKILDYLTLNANQILTKQQIIDAVWGIYEDVDDNSVVVVIAKPRNKLEKYGIMNLLTIWGTGYKWQG